MRVVLDAYWWVKGTQSLKGTVHGLIETWAREFPEDELVIVVRRRHADQLGELPLNVSTRSTRVWPQALLAMFIVPLVARRVGADAMFTHNFAPLFGRRRTVLLHDVMFETNPEWFTRKELLYYRWMVRVAPRAHTVFSTTRTEGDRIRRHTRARRVVPVGLGLDPELIHGREDSVPGLEPGRFVLAVGRLNARKNLATTLDGVRQSGQLSVDFPMVVVGEPDGAAEAMPEWVSAATEVGEVRFPGFVSTSQLRWLIRNCGIYACLSLDEGFGLPPVEAAALGAPVLVSDRAVFRETLGGRGMYVDPLSSTDIALAIQELARRASPAEPSARATGGDLVERFTWMKTVAGVRQEMLA